MFGYYSVADSHQHVYLYLGSQWKRRVFNNQSFDFVRAPNYTSN